MPHDEIIYLVELIDGENDVGDPIKVPQKNDYIFAKKKSIHSSEFYQAAAKGLRPELMFEVHDFEYSGEHMLEYNEKLYKIIRTYEKGDGFIELVCQGIVNGVM